MPETKIGARGRRRTRPFGAAGTERSTAAVPVTTTVAIAATVAIATAVTIAAAPTSTGPSRMSTEGCDGEQGHARRKRGREQHGCERAGQNGHAGLPASNDPLLAN